MIAPWVIKAPMEGPPARTGTGAVISRDNLATRKSAAAAKAMRGAGCWFPCLPPYGPNLNPIEMAFTKLKANPRRTEARTLTDIFDALPKSAIPSRRTSVGTALRLPDMSLVKGRVL